MPKLDTCTEDTAELCKLPGGRGGRFKLPTLTELHSHLFGEPFAEAHNATADVEATTRCFLELIRIGVFRIDQLQVDERYIDDFKAFNPAPFQKVGLTHLNLKAESEKLKKATQQEEGISSLEENENKVRLKDVDFVHFAQSFPVFHSSVHYRRKGIGEKNSNSGNGRRCVDRFRKHDGCLSF
jgi:DNA polymerase III subunit alpha